MRKKNLTLWLVWITLITAFFLFPFFGVQAEEDGGNIIFSDTKRFAPVFFSHQKHKAVGNQCNDCHPKLFKKKKGSTDAKKALSMKNFRKGLYCGTCHDGGKAFSVKTSCDKCHVKSK